MAHKQNYLEKAELNKQRKLESGLVSECFPGVSFIVIQMTYYLKGIDQASMVRTVNFWPSRHAYFNMDCMIKDCVDGGFDLTSVIALMIKKREKSGKGEISCKGKISNRASQHSRVAYKITIKYGADSQRIKSKNGEPRNS
jgi:hypothetical protein